MICVHVRERSDRTFLQLYYIDPLTGNDRTRSAGTNDWGEAERAAQRWEEEIAGRGTPDHLSWEQFRIRYEDEHLSGKARNTRRTANTAMDHFEKAVGKPRRLAGVDASILSQVAATWRRSGMPDTSIHAYLGHLRAAFGWAARVGLIDRPPRFTMPRLPERHMKGRPITLKEYRLIARATRELVRESWRDWVRFQRGLWLSGLRLGEAIALDWEAGPVRVDLDSGRHPRLRFRAEGHKARRDELVPITPEFAAWLRRTAVDARHGPVLPLRSTKGGKPIVCVKRVGRVLSEIGEAANVVVNEDGKYASAHDFRRSFGTRWANKVRPVTLKALMRHRAIETTLRYYVDQDADDVAEELWR